MLFRPFQRMSREEASRAEARARNSADADPEVGYPAWYHHRWHCLPSGYLSAGSVRMYDRVIRPLYYEARERGALDVLADEVAGMRPAAVLEIGCGTGRSLAAIGKSAPGTRLAGVDLSPFMVSASRRRLGPDVTIVHADATELPWGDGAFDVVVAAHLLGHVPHAVAERLVFEAQRVLDPTGRLVVLEHRWHALPLDGWRSERTHAVAGGLIHVSSFSA